MNARTSIATLLFAVIVAPAAAAQESTQSLPAVKAEVVRHVTDCERRDLPTQRDVGEWTGQNNFSQVYDTRQRLMAEIGRACQKPGIQQVQLVTRGEPAPRELNMVAITRRRGN